MARLLLTLLLFVMMSGMAEAQDEIVIKRTGKPLDYELKILSVSKDTIYFRAFWKDRKMPLSEVESYKISTEQKVITKDSLRYKQQVFKELNRNVIAIGYQIGGYSLVGIEYEIRFHDYFGVNFGAGASGYTGGIKIHTNPKKNSPFFLASYKDGGFGLINTFGVEFGGRWVLSQKSDFGIIYQVGLAKITKIDSYFEQQLFSGKAPAVILSLGVGISW